MGDNEMKTMADALWSYFADKYMIPYLSDSVCYFNAVVTSDPNGTTIGVQRPFDNVINLPYAWSAETLTVGDQCIVIVFGDMSNAIVIGDGTLSLPGNVPTPYTSNPKMDGTADPGSSTKWARGDHVHPTDTTRAPVASPAFTGTPTAPTAAAGTSSTQIATTEFVSTATQKYVSELNAWISFQSDYFINISASQHGKGTTPNVDVYIKDGDYYYKYYGTPSHFWQIRIAETTGDVRIISSVPFQGRIIIT